MIRMRGNLVAVTAPKKGSGDGFIVGVDDANTVGVIKYLGPDAADDLKEGQKVYFGTKRNEVTVDGKKLLVMASDNVVAIVEA